MATKTGRWHSGQHRLVESETIEAFAAEIAEVCRRHRMTIGCEDSHAAFIIEPLSPNDDGNVLEHAHISESFTL